MLYNDSGPIPGFEPRKTQKEEERVEEKIEERVKWGSFIFEMLVVSGLVIFYLALHWAIISHPSPTDYGKDPQACFSHLTTLDRPLLQESDPHALIKEIKRDIITNHLAPLCGWAYENMNKDTIQKYFPNVLFDPTGI